MKLIYLANARIPTEKTHGYQIAKMCEEFAAAGAEVELWLPTRANAIKQEAFAFYGLERNFTVKKIFCPDLIGFEFLGKAAFIIQSACFSLAVFLKILFSRKKAGARTIYYSRDFFALFPPAVLKRDVFLELHLFSKSQLRYKYYYINKIKGLVATTANARFDLLNMGVRPEKILISPNGADLKSFAAATDDRAGLRAELNLPADKKIIMYVGHYYGWKGVGAIIAAAGLLKDDDNIVFFLVGGTEEYHEKYLKIVKEKRLANLRLLGFQAKKNVPKFLKCADVLLLSNSAETEESIKYTSPLKMFEYMASRRPIVASDLPSIREVLSEKNCFFYRPEDAADLAEKIKLALSEPALSEKLADQAFKDVKKYSWDKRARSILEFIAKNANNR